MNVVQIKAIVASNLGDPTFTQFTDAAIGESIQDAYNLIAAKTLCIQKSINFPQIPDQVYYRFGDYFPDILAVSAIFNYNTNRWLLPVDRRQFDVMRWDWELMTGEPQWFSPENWRFTSIVPHQGTGVVIPKEPTLVPAIIPPFNDDFWTGGEIPTNVDNGAGSYFLLSKSIYPNSHTTFVILDGLILAEGVGFSIINNNVIKLTTAININLTVLRIWYQGHVTLPNTFINNGGGARGFCVFYRARAELLVDQSIPNLPNQTIQALEYYATKDQFESIREYTKAKSYKRQFLATLPEITKLARQLGFADKLNVMAPSQMLGNYAFTGLTDNMWIGNETPVGTQDGVNTVFTLAGTPNPTSTFMVILNGVVLANGIGYILASNTLILTSATPPNASSTPPDTLRVWYQT